MGTCLQVPYRVPAPAVAPSKTTAASAETEKMNEPFSLVASDTDYIASTAASADAPRLMRIPRPTELACSVTRIFSARVFRVISHLSHFVTPVKHVPYRCVPSQKRRAS
jgi:hypothetical protein